MKCCGKEWKEQEMGFTSQNTEEDKIVVCLICGAFEQHTKGQLDEEEKWGFCEHNEIKNNECAVCGAPEGEC